jgi:hypothetical protein
MRNDKREYDFYFTHNSFFTKNMVQSLKDGYIRLGKDLPKKYRVLGGYEPLNEIYGNILFDDLYKKQIYWGPTFIIKPEIVEKYDVGLRFGWQGDETLVKTSDSNNIFWKKIDAMHKFLKEAKLKVKLGTGKITKRELHWQHEVVFRKKINIKKYVSTIIGDFFTNEELEIIRKIIDKKKYNIKIIKRDNSKKENFYTLTSKQII